MNNFKKTVAVTGATSGIGFAVCEGLLKSGCRVIAVGHSSSRCDTAAEKLRADFPNGYITFLCADLMQQAEVSRLAEEIRQDLEENSGGALDALVNNAGCIRSWFMTTSEGYEQQFALNHLAGFLLTHELFPNLVEGDGSVLMTSSGSHKMMKVNWQDIMYQKRYRPLLAYKQSKLCNVLFAYSLNERYAACGIRAYAIDPGLVQTDIGQKNTGKLVDFIWKRRKKHGVQPDVPAGIYCRLIDGASKSEGLYHALDGVRPHNRFVTQKNADRLFTLSEKLCRISFGERISCLS